MAPQQAPRVYMVTDAMILSRDWYRKQGPFFRVEEVSKFFFGMSASWLRLKMAEDADHPETWFVYEDGTRIEFRRAAPTITVRLSDVEQMVRSLHGFGAITREEMTQALEVARAEKKRTAHREQPPSYPVRKFAKLFLKMRASWVEQKMTEDEDHPETWFVHPDGTRMEFTKELSTARLFLLSDVELMAYSLYDFGAITAERLVKILDIVRGVADLYHLFDEPGAEAADAEEDTSDEDEPGDEE